MHTMKLAGVVPFPQPDQSKVQRFNGLKDKGIIALIVKSKNTCDYYMAMPTLSAEVQASRESTNPPKQAGFI